MIALRQQLFLALILVTTIGGGATGATGAAPIVVNTWPFTAATARAWKALEAKEDAVTAVQLGVSTCERLQCDGTVGYGGSPDEIGQTTLDAMIIDGNTLAMGSAVGLHTTSDAIAAARLVMDYTNHSILAGRDADAFAQQMGLPRTNLVTNHSRELWSQWKSRDCQPNYRRGVLPDPRRSCGPYRPRSAAENVASIGVAEAPLGTFGRENHDTIAMIAIDGEGAMAAGTSTNGATHKVPGRIADSGIPGSGAYADSQVGGCGATGDGDVMMRFVPCYQVVESMRRGLSPKEAVEDAIGRIRARHPTFQGALLALDRDGHHAGATNCMDFHYSVASIDHPDVDVIPVKGPACPTSKHL